MKIAFSIAAMMSLTLATVSYPVMAGSYGAGIENSRWYLSESVFDCSLTHEVPRYGRAVFHHRAGEDLAFYLESDSQLMRPGEGRLVIEAPVWRPGVAPRALGAVYVESSNRPVTLDARRSMQLMTGLIAGMAPTVTRQAWYSDEAIRVILSNINFSRLLDGYRACVSGLLPVNYDQIKRSRIPFGAGSVALSPSDYERLDLIVLYVQADPTVERVFVDGHTDRSGSRINNRALSEARANAVAAYLMERGIPAERLTVRSHGDQYPMSRRAADNRRTTIRLQRQGERPELQRADNGYAGDANG
ncbi:flagellar protein MotY [Marinobacter caseinilyticus]|uniref:flagellar protein MotY n=1 Tax=Marinobacter caseinilyticus TaxID=2692195 RepID=UPI001407D3BB|nr:OmpA family protein [Marinobacter caseinilyticus]